MKKGMLVLAVLLSSALVQEVQAADLEELVFWGRSGNGKRLVYSLKNHGSEERVLSVRSEETGTSLCTYRVEGLKIQRRSVVPKAVFNASVIKCSKRAPEALAEGFKAKIFLTERNDNGRCGLLVSDGDFTIDISAENGRCASWKN